MLVADLPPNLIRVAGTIVGAGLGVGAGALADRLPGRYGIVHVAGGRRRTRRNVALVVLSALLATAIAHVVTRAPSMGLGQAAAIFAMNAVVTAAALSAAAIDLEHMILPNELTMGAALLCVLVSPIRSIELSGSLGGAAVGLLVSYVPHVLYRKLRGQSGMGLGDAKLSIMAGAWHGPLGVIVVLFAGAVQSVIAAAAMRVLSIRYEVPESVAAEIADLRARAAAGDNDAALELAEDPMAAEERDDALGARLPFGPFLVLACVEVLFFRRWIVEHVASWLLR